SEETLHAPTRTPGIHDGEALRGIVIPHRQDSMPPQYLFAGSRHWHDASFGDLLRFEALVHGEAENKGIARGKTALELCQRLDETLVRHGLVLLGVLVTGLRRLAGELCYRVRPLFLCTHPLFGNALNAIANHCSSV